METSKEKKVSREYFYLPFEFFKLLFTIGCSNRPRADALFVVCDYEFYGKEYEGKDPILHTLLHTWKMNYSQRTAAQRRKYYRTYAKLLDQLNDIVNAKEEID